MRIIANGSRYILEKDGSLFELDYKPGTIDMIDMYESVGRQFRLHFSSAWRQWILDEYEAGNNIGDNKCTVEQHIYQYTLVKQIFPEVALEGTSEFPTYEAIQDHNYFASWFVNTPGEHAAIDYFDPPGHIEALIKNYGNTDESQFVLCDQSRLSILVKVLHQSQIGSEYFINFIMSHFDGATVLERFMALSEEDQLSVLRLSFKDSRINYDAFRIYSDCFTKDMHIDDINLVIQIIKRISDTSTVPYDAELLEQIINVMQAIRNHYLDLQMLNGLFGDSIIDQTITIVHYMRRANNVDITLLIDDLIKACKILAPENPAFLNELMDNAPNKVELLIGIMKLCNAAGCNSLREILSAISHQQDTFQLLIGKHGRLQKLFAHCNIGEGINRKFNILLSKLCNSNLILEIFLQCDDKEIDTNFQLLQDYQLNNNSLLSAMPRSAALNKLRKIISHIDLVDQIKSIKLLLSRMLSMFESNVNEGFLIGLLRDNALIEQLLPNDISQDLINDYLYKLLALSEVADTENTESAMQKVAGLLQKIKLLLTLSNNKFTLSYQVDDIKLLLQYLDDARQAQSGEQQNCMAQLQLIADLLEGAAAKTQNPDVKETIIAVGGQFFKEAIEQEEKEGRLGNDTIVHKAGENLLRQLTNSAAIVASLAQDDGYIARSVDQFARVLADRQAAEDLIKNLKQNLDFLSEATLRSYKVTDLALLWQYYNNLTNIPYDVDQLVEIARLMRNALSGQYIDTTHYLDESLLVAGTIKAIGLHFLKEKIKQDVYSKINKQDIYHTNSIIAAKAQVLNQLDRMDNTPEGIIKAIEDFNAAVTKSRLNTALLLVYRFWKFIKYVVGALIMQIAKCLGCLFGMKETVEGTHSAPQPR